jgi:chemotaxis signal transduction protein
MNTPSTDATRRLMLLHIESVALGVFEEEVTAVVEWSEPTPLPFAPASVLGVVSVQGRMFTVLEIGGILGASVKANRQLIVVLRGDEQLAIAVDATDPVLEIDLAEIDGSTSRLISGTARVAGERVLLLDIDGLFHGAIQGYERRRRRF